MGRISRSGLRSPWPLSAVAVLYSAWLLSYVLPTRIGTVDAYVSELTARDQPHRMLYVACDTAAGLLAIAVAARAWRAERARRAPREVVAAWAALGVFGLATVLDASFPLDCAPSVTAACHTAESLGQVSASHEIHSGTSTLAYAAILANMLLVCRSERRAPGTWPRLGRAAVPLAAATAVSTAVVLALVPSGAWVGLPQRVSLLAMAAWLVGLGLAGAARAAGESGAGPGADSGPEARRMREMSAR